MTARGPRHEAKIRGELTYWTGKPCKKGHVDFRRTDNGNCCTCDRAVQRPRSKARYDADPARAVAAAVRYRAEHLEEVQARVREWSRQKRQTDPQFYLRGLIRKLTNKALHTPKHRRLIIGCTGTQFQQWLEAQFADGMTWDNYPEVWTIDHIKPLTAFDLTDQQQFFAACHYTNTRPMPSIENIKKGGIRIRRPTDHQARTSGGRPRMSPAR